MRACGYPITLNVPPLVGGPRFGNLSIVAWHRNCLGRIGQTENMLVRGGPGGRRMPALGELDELARRLRCRPWVALTGAGMSTDSGIPDYRGPSARPTAPMQYADFVRHPEARQRYWARSMLGWQSFGAARPNDGHFSLAALDRAGLIGVITQNVDGLHEAAGSRGVINLHGRIDQVVCLDCGRRSGRGRLQVRLRAVNAEVRGELGAGAAELDDPSRLRPDGDAVVDEWHRFVVVPCEDCGGVLKPDVVFFGEQVPRTRVDKALGALAGASVLVVLGSSLTVMSGLRFARQQVQAGRELVIINRGPTRADDLAHLRIHGGCSETLAQLMSLLDPAVTSDHSAEPKTTRLEPHKSTP